MYISTIICTHNPRDDYFPRVLEALRNQCLPKDQWELLIIDNGSRDPLAFKWPIDWHPNARHIREDELGLTPARMRGIRESKGEYLVFVDDDNVLDSSYLANVVKIAANKPWIGAFGGSCIGEFEHPPEADTTFMFDHLAIREITDESWACSPGINSINYAPVGAGMVVAASVARWYAEQASLNPLRKMLDRCGNSLMSCGDTDLALCACELRLAVGLFPTLRLTHLIPSGRLDKDYLIRLAERMSYSYALLNYIWTDQLPNIQPFYRGRIDKALIRTNAMMKNVALHLTGEWSSFRQQFERAKQKGIESAYVKANELKQMKVAE
jgi:glycosyltransferase involved in cell wall biosynthesis